MDFRDIKQRPKPREEGCKIRMKRDSSGKIREVEFSDKCTPKHLEAFQNKMKELDDDGNS